MYSNYKSIFIKFCFRMYLNCIFSTLIHSIISSLPLMISADDRHVIFVCKIILLFILNLCFCDKMRACITIVCVNTFRLLLNRTNIFFLEWEFICSAENDRIFFFRWEHYVTHFKWEHYVTHFEFLVIVFLCPFSDGVSFSRSNLLVY